MADEGREKADTTPMKITMKELFIKIYICSLKYYHVLKCPYDAAAGMDPFTGWFAPRHLRTLAWIGGARALRCCLFWDVSSSC